ncbi:MAG: hypothetical protein R3A48_16435 [Polyangiales bacterium]
MLRHLSLADGFVLGFVYVAEDQRARWDALAQQLPGELARARGAEVPARHLRGERLARDPCVGAEPGDLLDGLLDAVGRDEPWSLVVLDGTRATGPEDDAWIELFERLNERRNALRERHRGALLLAVHARMEGVLARNAPDLWSIRGPVLRLGETDPDADLEAPHEPGFTRSDLARIDECLAAEPSGERRARWAVRAALCSIALQRSDLARERLSRLERDPAAAHPDLLGWRAMLRGDLDAGPAPLRARAWSDAADALQREAHWAIVTALRLRAADALKTASPASALRALDDAAHGVAPDADEVTRASFDFEIVTRRVDLLSATSPSEARALAEALVEELRVAHRRTRRNAPERLLAHALLRLGDLASRGREPDAALRAWREALRIVEGLRARDPARDDWARGEAQLRGRIEGLAGVTQRQTTSRG